MSVLALGKIAFVLLRVHIRAFYLNMKASGSKFLARIEAQSDKILYRNHQITGMVRFGIVRFLELMDERGCAPFRLARNRGILQIHWVVIPGHAIVVLSISGS